MAIHELSWPTTRCDLSSVELAKISTKIN